MLVNLSEKNRSFVWTPPKTASTLASFVFDKYDFDCYRVESGRRVLRQNGFAHIHDLTFFEGHNDYTFILSCRNPYSQLISYFGSDSPFSKDLTKRKIFRYLEEKKHLIFLDLLDLRKPDLILKVESLEEGYNKINFISNSDFSQSGDLKQMIDGKLNKSATRYDWKDLIDEELADVIYSNLSDYFQYFEYEKNSWKK